MGMFGYMTDTETVEPIDTVKIESEGDDMESLLFHFLDDWLYKFSAEIFFIPREVKVLHIDRMNFKIRSLGWGEEFSLAKHPQIPHQGKEKLNPMGTTRNSVRERRCWDTLGDWCNGCRVDTVNNVRVQSIVGPGWILLRVDTQRFHRLMHF
ncbi:protein archease isoform X3 [Nerophis ophidion]|nr:protein archease isoform X3 [Nerophis ophidion]XP_061751501.1 protein archease isoform X3 [Nerophis ophidion]